MANVYGISIDTLSPTFAPLTDDTSILRQWVNLQLETALGFYWSAPEIGCDIQNLILRGLTPDKIAAIPADIESALGEDQRIAGVVVTPATSFTAIGAEQLNLTIVVTPKDASVAPFSLSAVATAAVADQVTAGLGV